MRKHIRHHWTKAHKKLAARYGQMALFAIVLGVFFAVLAGGWLLKVNASNSAPQHAEQHFSVPPNVTIGGSFSLINQNGKAVHDTDFRGKFLLVYFGYTYCPDVCPTGLQGIAHVLDNLGAASDKIQTLFITIDPARDTPAKMKDYVASFHPQIIGLTGSAEQIAAVAKEYQIYYAKGEPVDEKDYVMDHSSPIFLMSPSGAFINAFDDEVDPAELEKAIRSSMSKPAVPSAAPHKP